jgi:hypothetical protein
MRHPAHLERIACPRGVTEATWCGWSTSSLAGTTAGSWRRRRSRHSQTDARVARTWKTRDRVNHVERIEAGFEVLKQGDITVYTVKDRRDCGWSCAKIRALEPDLEC